MDGSGSSVCSPMINNNYMVTFFFVMILHCVMVIMISVGSSDSFRIVSDYSVDVVKKRIFRIGDVHVLSDL